VKSGVDILPTAGFGENSESAESPVYRNGNTRDLVQHPPTTPQTASLARSLRPQGREGGGPVEGGAEDCAGPDRVTFADDEQDAAAERVICQVVEFLPQLIQERQKDTLKKLVNVILTDVTPSKAARVQARMLIEAKTDILNSGDILPATEVARLAGFSASKLNVQPNKWKRTREIFAIQHGREDYLPVYGLAPGVGARQKARRVCAA
jgi:hypothetical protein